MQGHFIAWRLSKYLDWSRLISRAGLQGSEGVKHVFETPTGLRRRSLLLFPIIIALFRASWKNLVQCSLSDWIWCSTRLVMFELWRFQGWSRARVCLTKTGQQVRSSVFGSYTWVVFGVNSLAFYPVHLGFSFYLVPWCPGGLFWLWEEFRATIVIIRQNRLQQDSFQSFFCVKRSQSRL